jgi:hypothetical protein
MVRLKGSKALMAEFCEAVLSGLSNKSPTCSDVRGGDCDSTAANEARRGDAIQTNEQKHKQPLITLALFGFSDENRHNEFPRASILRF